MASDRTMSMSVSPIDIEVLDGDDKDKDKNVGANSIDVGMPGIFRFWQLYVLYAICICVSGAWVTFIDNTPQIIEAASSSAEIDDENGAVSNSLIVITSFRFIANRLNATR